MVGEKLEKYLAKLEKEMKEHAANLDFEKAAECRDEIKRLQNRDLEITAPFSSLRKSKNQKR
jgi:excinuclease ABC subunit B